MYMKSSFVRETAFQIERTGYGGTYRIRERKNEYEFETNTYFDRNGKSWQAVKEWLRVTKKGGRVIIIDADWYFEDTSIAGDLYLQSQNSQAPEKRSNYSKMIDDMLPLVTGTRNAGSLLHTLGYQILQYDLSHIDQIERSLLCETSEEMINFKKRFVYIIEKTPVSFTHS